MTIPYGNNGSLDPSRNQVNGPVTGLDFCTPRPGWRENSPRVQWCQHLFCLGLIWHPNFRTSIETRNFSNKICGNPQKTLRQLVVFHSKLRGGKPGKPSQPKSHGKTQSELLAEGSPRAGKATPGGWLWCGMFFFEWGVGGFNCQNRCDVLERFIQRDLLISLKLGKSLLMGPNEVTTWRTWLLWLLSILYIVSLTCLF